MKKILFLDLEQTIITSWNDPHLINMHVIRKFINENDFSDICIFSFAIYHQEDKHTFVNHPDYKSKIERCLDITINIEHLPSIEDLKILFAREYNLPPSRVDRGRFLQLQ